MTTIEPTLNLSSSPLNAARRMLLGPQPWLLEGYELTSTHLRARGWALTGYEAPSDYVFLVNGARPTQRTGLESPHLAKIFPFYSTSAFAGFTLEYTLTGTENELRISYCDAYTGRSIWEWHDTFVPRSASNLPVPDEAQLIRTQGNSSKERFVAYGYTTFRRIEEILRIYFRRNISSFSSVLDWGSGCGRVSRYLIDNMSDSTVYGCDIDGENVAWCVSNLADGNFSCIDMMPPTKYPDNAFDLIIGISVLTHLTHEAERAWAHELARVLRPGGVAIMTVHGSSGFSRILNDQSLSELLKLGRFDAERDNRLDSVLDDREYYRATYHTGAAAASIFEGHLDFVASVPAANALVQDFLILMKPF